MGVKTKLLNCRNDGIILTILHVQTWYKPDWITLNVLNWAVRMYKGKMDDICECVCLESDSLSDIRHSIIWCEKQRNHVKLNSIQQACQIEFRPRYFQRR